MQNKFMKTNHTEITIVLDRSGSMSSIAPDTIGGFNRFLEDQKKAPGTASITLHQFDHEFETVIHGKNVHDAKPLTNATFVPRGNTALLDAIGRAITDTGVRLESTPEDQRAERVVFVIITDGHENASHEFSSPRIAEMIQHQREKYSWEFVFLGANQNAITSASRIGISPTNAMTYAGNSAGTKAAFASTSENLVRMRSGAVASMSYSEKDRDLQRKAASK